MAGVVVTGVGAVTPLGIGVDAFWQGLTAGRSGIRRIERFDVSNLDVMIGGEVPDFEPKAFMDVKAARRMDRFAQFGVAATRQALDDARLEITDANRDRIGIVMNTGGGGIFTIESNVLAMERQGPNRVSPCWATLLTVLKSPPTNNCVPSVVMALGPSGLPLVLGNQWPMCPSVGLSTTRCHQVCGIVNGPPSTWPWQSCMCEPSNSHPFSSTRAWVAPRHGSNHTREPSA